MFVMLLYLSNVPLWYFIRDLNLKKTNWKKEFLAENKMKRLLGMWICLKRKTIEKWGFWALNLSTKHTIMNENNFLVRFNNGQYFGVLFYGTWRNLRIWVVEHTGKIKKVSLMKDLFLSFGVLGWMWTKCLSQSYAFTCEEAKSQLPDEGFLMNDKISVPFRTEGFEPKWERYFWLDYC